MKDTLFKLWEAEIHEKSDWFEKYRAYFNETQTNKNALCVHLDDNEKILLEEYTESMHSLSLQAEGEAFMKGVCLGAKIMLDILC